MSKSTVRIPNSSAGGVNLYRKISNKIGMWIEPVICLDDYYSHFYHSYLDRHSDRLNPLFRSFCLFSIGINTFTYLRTYCFHSVLLKKKLILGNLYILLIFSLYLNRNCTVLECFSLMYF